MFSAALYVDADAMIARLRETDPSFIQNPVQDENSNFYSTLAQGGYSSCFLFMFSRPIPRGMISDLLSKVRIFDVGITCFVRQTI